MLIEIATLGLCVLLGWCTKSAADAAATPAESEDPVEGAWQVVEVVTTGPEARTVSAPQPGWRMFIDGHYTLLITNSFEPSAANPNEAGGFTIAQGCGGTNTSDSVTFVVEIVVGLDGDPTDKYDLEATAPARTLSISTTTGMPGSTIGVSGTDCFEGTGTAYLSASQGESGGPVAAATAEGGRDCA